MKTKGTSRITRTGPARRRARLDSGVPAPLDVVYARAGIPAPKVTTVSPARIPAPYRSLLVHERDMTLTLETHMREPETLYGRQTELTLEGRKIGDVVEILPVA